VSDLQCAATLLIARHGEAEHDKEVLTDSGGSLSLRGREQARELGRRLRDARVAMIYCSGMARAVQTAEIVAAELGLPVKVRDNLREWAVGEYAGQEYVEGMFDDTLASWHAGELAAMFPGGESGSEILARVSEELEAIVDEHRGETVLVVSHGGVMSFAVPHLAANVRDDFAKGRALRPCDLVEVAADADAWVLRAWAGHAVG
jgi:probable phosphoglycerate mutase